MNECLSFDIAESENRWYNRRLFQQRAPSLFRPRHLVVLPCFLPQSFLDMLPPLLPKGKTGRMSGGHSESLTDENIHEVQNSIVWYRTLLSLHSYCQSCCQTGREAAV